MSLINDIQAAAISQTTDVPTLLRMCKLLAARISHQQFADWVDRELNGYPDFESLPDYRVTPVDSYGSFHGSSFRINRLQIAVSILPEELQERYRYAYMGSSISAYTSFLEGDKGGSIQEPWPVALAIHHASKLTPDMQCVAAWKEIPMGAVVRLMDSVKTRILGFAIDLEREASNVGDTPIGSQFPLSNDKMTQIFNTNIAGNVGNISNSGRSFSQKVSIKVGNWGSLEKYLIDAGLKPAEFEGMKAEFDRAVASGKEVEKISAAGTWSGRLAAKAMRGVTGVGFEVIVAGIAKAIATYLGLPGS